MRVYDARVLYTEYEREGNEGEKKLEEIIIAVEPTRWRTRARKYWEHEGKHESRTTRETPPTFVIVGIQLWSNDGNSAMHSSVTGIRTHSFAAVQAVLSAASTARLFSCAPHRCDRAAR